MTERRIRRWRAPSSTPQGDRHSGWIRGTIAVAVLSVVAVACGGGAQVTASDSEDEVEDSQVETDQAAPDAEVDETAAESSEVAGDAEEATTAGPPRVVFPDVEVVEIASGQALNVADQLSGTGKATLLWFFAPH